MKKRVLPSICNALHCLLAIKTNSKEKKLENIDQKLILILILIQADLLVDDIFESTLTTEDSRKRLFSN